MKRFTLFIVFFVIFGGFLHAQSVKMISFNIRYNGDANEDGQYAWVYRAPSVLQMIKQEQPDVMGVQEALLDQLSAIDHKFAGKYRRVGVGRDNGLTRGEHMAIYYNRESVELLGYYTRWLSQHPTRVSMGWDAACMRTVTIAHFRQRATDKEFWYFNTHLDHVGKVARKESIKLINKTVSSMVSSGTAVIVGGDMNQGMESPIFNPLYTSGFKMARLVAPISDTKASFNAFGKMEPATIDHFFVRDVTLEKFITLDDDYGIKYISDHYPIEIIFSL